MAVTINDPIHLGDGVFLVTYSSSLGDGTTFYIYVDGVLAVTTELTSWTFTVPSGGADASLHVEILDEEKDAPQGAWPMTATIAWYAVDDTDHYLVEEDDSGWTERQKIKDRGEEYYRWESRVLEDITTHNFRVTAVGTNGNSSTVASLSIYAVHHPVKPAVSLAYSDSTKKVTISAA